jgi:hypothetical protein
MCTRSTLVFPLIALFAAEVLAQQEASDDEFAATGELALSNDTLQVRYLGRGPSMGDQRSTLMGTFFLSEERDIVLSAALLFPAKLGIERLSIVIGPQVYAALLEEENNDVMAVSLGTEVRFVLLRDLGLSISGQAFYSPDILTFGSADNLTDLSARLELAVAPRLTAFGGMRWFEFDLTEGGGERTLQEEVFVGFGYRF